MQNGAYTGGDVGGGNVAERCVWVRTHRVEGSVGCCALCVQREHTGGKGGDRAQSLMAGTAVADAFVTNAVLLLGERGRDERGGQEVGGGAREVIEGPRADPELEIAKAKDVGIGSSRAAQIFARTQKEEETDNEAFGSGACLRGCLAVCHGPDKSNKGEGKRFDTTGRWVFFFPGLQQASETEIGLAGAV